jgi:hypothetical protein
VPESIGDQKTGHDGQQESGKLRTVAQDIIIITKKGILPLSYQDVCRELESRLINRADE